GLKCRPFLALYKPMPRPIFTKCKTYCLELPAFQVPCRTFRKIVRIDFLRSNGLLEFAVERGKDTRATIIDTVGCCRVRWVSRTRMGNAGARESDSYCKGWATLGASIPSVCLPTAG